MTIAGVSSYQMVRHYFHSNLKEPHQISVIAAPHQNQIGILFLSAAQLELLTLCVCLLWFWR